jgi:bifunctional DNase/RNase
MVLVEVKVQSLGLDRTTNNPVVILQEEEGERILPIWIGPGEASAIAMEMADMTFTRPLTHDLLVSVVGGLGGALERVVITRVEDNTYFAELIIEQNGNTVTVDARPSDSIAVALRTKAPILADDGLLEQVTVEIAEEESAAGQSFEPPVPLKDPPSGETLKDYLRKLNPEDFGRFTP